MLRVEREQHTCMHAFIYRSNMVCNMLEHNESKLRFVDGPSDALCANRLVLCCNCQVFVCAAATRRMRNTRTST